MESVYVIVVAAWLVVHGIAAISLGWWTYLDASDRGSERAVLWALLVGFLLVPVAVYLLVRDRIGARSGPISDTERAVGTASVGTLVGVVSGTLAPPDPVTGGLYTFAALPVGLAVGYALVWRGGLWRLRDRGGR